MAEAKSKSKTPVVCTLCDKPITTGKPVMIDDDPYHSDCAKAMEQSAGAADETEEEDEEAEEAEEEEDGEDESDEDEEDEEEDEEPAPRTTKVAAKAPAKSAKRVVAEEDDDEDEDDEDDEDDEEEEEVVVRPAAKKAAAPAKKAAPVKARRVVEEDDEDEDDEDEEEEEVVVRKPVAKAATKPVVKAKAVAKRAAADEDEEYEEEDEPEERPRKAKSTATATKVAKKPTVDVSGWGNPATLGSKRYFVYQALKEVTKTSINEADGPGKPENVVARAKRLQRDYARENKITLSEKDKNYTSMNIGWIYNHADELKLVMRTNPEAGTYRILKAAVSDDSD